MRHHYRWQEGIPADRNDRAMDRMNEVSARRLVQAMRCGGGKGFGKMERRKLCRKEMVIKPGLAEL